MRIKNFNGRVKKLIALVLIMQTLTITELPLYAAERVEIRDESGHELIISKDGTLKMTGNCVFNFSGNFDGKILVNDMGIDGKEENFTELKDKRYRISYGEEKNISFVVLDEDKMLFRPVNGLPEIIQIRPSKAVDEGPKVNFTYEMDMERNSVAYLKGRRPEIELGASEGMATYLEIRSGDQLKKIRVIDEKYIYDFAEGNYSIKVWNEDSKGRKYEAELPFNNFIYDKTAPEKPQLENNLIIRNREEILVNENTKIKLTSKDDRSGIKKYLFETQDGKIREGREVSIDENFKGGLKIYAMDNCGNMSEALEIPKIISDREAPHIKKFTAETENDLLIINAEAEDKLSDIKEINISLDGELLAAKKDKSVVKAEIPLKIMKKGKHKLILSCVDRAENKSHKEMAFLLEDDRAPKISLKGIENMGLYNRDIVLTTEAADDELKSLSCIAEKYDEDGNLTERKEYPGGKIKFTEEGNYKIKVVAEDMSGNRSELIRCFSIDKTAPEIADLSNIDQKYLRNIFLKRDSSYIAYDPNLKETGIFLNGQKYDGKKITEPGHYVLSVKAVDKAGNDAESAVEFVIRHKDNRSH
ncbi:MAG: hypothetical protein K5894_11215 [Lachnospiraceae bacterium]|nr:hypothetical protein [Lachnospiraceae bacterium]